MGCSYLLISLNYTLIQHQLLIVIWALFPSKSNSSMTLRKFLEKKDSRHKITFTSHEDRSIYFKKPKELSHGDGHVHTIHTNLPTKSPFSGLFNRGRARIRPSQTETHNRTSSKHLLEMLHKSKSMESFQSQESTQSSQTLPSKLAISTDINFDEILKADDTKRVSLTPNRLRSIEVFKKLQKLQSREPTISSSLVSPETDLFKIEDDEFMVPRVRKSETLYEFLKNSGPEDFSPPKPASIKKPKSYKHAIKSVISRNLGASLKPLITLQEKSKGNKKFMNISEFLRYDSTDSMEFCHTNVERISQIFNRSSQFLSPDVALPRSNTTPTVIQEQSHHHERLMKHHRSVSEPLGPKVVESKGIDLYKAATPLLTDLIQESDRRYSLDFSELTDFGSEVVDITSPKIPSSIPLATQPSTRLIQTLPTLPITPKLTVMVEVEEFHTCPNSPNPLFEVHFGATDTEIGVFDLPCMCNDCLNG
ncbi:hypothetical protein K7432_001024 [Basidiobolus ranarum]|uniref:Uncharacterized protein n=1 Tax=Basidiobolus ranarum TaxID=34480 RepID=A0ABR2WAA7_9FUNG